MSNSKKIKRLHVPVKPLVLRHEEPVMFGNKRLYCLTGINRVCGIRCESGDYFECALRDFDSDILCYNAFNCNPAIAEARILVTAKQYRKWKVLRKKGKLIDHDR